MDETIVDLLYFLTIGVPPRNMSINTKLANAANKLFKFVFNIQTTDKVLFSTDDLENMVNHVQKLTSLYQTVLVQYFSDKKTLLDLSEECRFVSSLLHV